MQVDKWADKEQPSSTSLHSPCMVKTVLGAPPEKLPHNFVALSCAAAWRAGVLHCPFSVPHTWEAEWFLRTPDYFWHEIYCLGFKSRLYMLFHYLDHQACCQMEQYKGHWWGQVCHQKCLKKIWQLSGNIHQGSSCFKYFPLIWIHYFFICSIAEVISLIPLIFKSIFLTLPCLFLCWEI